MDCLAQMLPKTSKDVWSILAEMPADELPIHHFGLGLYLRNNVLTPESELYKLFMQAGIWHKDDMSSLMIKRWHEALNGQPEASCAGRDQTRNYVWKVTKMEATGMIRAIDELGRIVLPTEARARFGLKEKDTLEVLSDESGIYLKPYDTKHCAFCTDKEDLISHGGRYICATCLKAINEQTACK